MTYLPDTNAVSDLMRQDPRIESWISGLNSGARVVTCTVVRGEILYSIARLAPGKRRGELELAGQQILNACRCEPIPPDAAAFYADLKVARQQRGLGLDENDLWVAATALALGAPLVTRDSDFRGIPALSVVAPD